MSATPEAGPAGAQLVRQSYAAFSARLNRAAQAQHLPLNGAFELTFRCNFNCVHCYEQDVRDTPELPTARWLELVDEVADAGCLWLTLTGGEAILHPGFEEIYERATRRGLLLTVFSNGSTLTEPVARLFQRLPPRRLEVTLYGASPKTYLESTGRARNHQLAFEGVRRMVALGVPVALKTVVFDKTRADFQAIRDFAKELGQEFRFDTTLHASLGGTADPTAHRLSPEEIVAVEALDKKPFEDARARHGTPATRPTDQVYRCGAGRYAFDVAPDGYLQLCTLVRSIRHDLSRVSFHEAWDRMATEVQRRYAATNRRCSGCELRHMCGTCPGIAELEKGDVEAAIDHICETTYRRASAVLGRTLIPPWKQARGHKLTVLSEGVPNETAATGEHRGAGCGACACGAPTLCGPRP